MATGFQDPVHDQPDKNAPSKFQPTDKTQSTPTHNLPDELWLTILESPCTFPPEIFTDVMLNLVKNPNVTSSHLFRADIFYDNDRDPSTSVDEDGNVTEGNLVKHLKVINRPRSASLEGFVLARTIVRELIPRNPQLDKPLVQTCHFFQRRAEEAQEETVVLYIPHVDKASEVPFYHPTVQRLAFHHEWQHGEDDTGVGSVSVSFQLFPEEAGGTLSTKLSRTALKLLQTVHKHGQGRLMGYEKRVHLDQIIPQKRYQDTYTRLKRVYGKKLASEWVEVTDPGKHVFEDLGIAAFLIELWRDMYNPPGRNDEDPKKQNFPGFVDIGCGNGVLTYILLSEGYLGWGFDARQRKTWSTFPEEIQVCLKRRILVPELSTASRDELQTSSNQQQQDKPVYHNGLFEPRTFIISNHADELTAWTPLLAYLNDGAFVAIPCCSHDLSGARFRAPASTKSARAKETVGKGKRGQFSSNGLSEAGANERDSSIPSPDSGEDPKSRDLRSKQASETGSLSVRVRNSPSEPNQQEPRSAKQDCTTAKQSPNNARQGGTSNNNGKMPSAYSTLCSYVRSLTSDLGFRAETDVLRIPSTRNACIIGREYLGAKGGGDAARDVGKKEMDEGSLEARKLRIRGIVEVEMGKSWEEVEGEWKGRVERLEKKPGSGH